MGFGRFWSIFWTVFGLVDGPLPEGPCLQTLADTSPWHRPAVNTQSFFLHFERCAFFQKKRVPWEGGGVLSGTTQPADGFRLASTEANGKRRKTFSNVDTEMRRGGRSTAGPYRGNRFGNAGRPKRLLDVTTSPPSRPPLPHPRVGSSRETR